MSTHLYDALDDAKKHGGTRDIEETIKAWCNNQQINLNLYSPELAHTTELKCPEQTKLFKEIIEKMYQIHLDKNADYSPFNIIATGMTGLCTRIWDKTARIMSLYGFDLATGEYSSERKSTKDESIEDNLLDLSVYAIIGLIFRAGKWGK